MQTTHSALATKQAPRTRPRRPPRWRRRQARSALLVLVALAAGLVVWLAPFVSMVLGSLKTQAEIVAQESWWPQEPTLDNFAAWFGDLGFWGFFTNSVVVAVLTVLGNLLFCSMVGYALAKMDFPGKRTLFVLVMVTLMVPGVVTLVPLFVIVSNLGIVNSYAALVLPFLTSPIGVFLMRQFIAAIPDPLLEAARIDGAGEFRIFARIVLPLCGPALAALAILTFLASWNNFLWPLVAAQTEDMYTLPVALSLYSTGVNATKYGIMLAGALLVVLPIVLVFIFLQRYFIQGIATAGIK